LFILNPANLKDIRHEQVFNHLSHSGVQRVDSGQLQFDHQDPENEIDKIHDGSFVHPQICSLYSTSTSQRVTWM